MIIYQVIYEVNDIYLLMTSFVEDGYINRTLMILLMLSIMCIDEDVLYCEGRESMLECVFNVGMRINFIKGLMKG
jgi:hypothetical protein